MKMMKNIPWALAFLLIPVNFLTATGMDRFIQILPLRSGETIVVAEGDFEPRSVGSYSVRLYSGADPLAPTDYFLSGTIHARNGTILKVLRADLDRDQVEEILVVTQSAGSGGYLSVQAFGIKNKVPVPGISVTDLPADANPILELIKVIKSAPEPSPHGSAPMEKAPVTPVQAQ
jgi:hypothetical protein